MNQSRGRPRGFGRSVLRPCVCCYNASKKASQSPPPNTHPTTPLCPPLNRTPTHRFTITGGNRIAWLGWSLYVGYLPHYGPRFWDLKFKGERIAYELSMQEAMTSECGGGEERGGEGRCVCVARG